MWPVSALQEQATWCSTNDLKIKGTKEKENKGDKRRRTSHAFLIVFKKKATKKKRQQKKKHVFLIVLKIKATKKKKSRDRPGYQQVIRLMSTAAWVGSEGIEPPDRASSPPGMSPSTRGERARQASSAPMHGPPLLARIIPPFVLTA